MDAVFEGIAASLAVQLLLNLPGAGIAAAVIDPASNEQTSATSLSVSNVVWLVVSGLIASFSGAYISNGESWRPVRSTGVLHGDVYN